MIAPSNVVAIILAAGSSRRFGAGDKLLAEYRGHPLVVHVGMVARSLSFRRVLAVCRFDSEVPPLLRSLHIDVVINEAAESGMGSSPATGTAAARDLHAEACLVLLGDMPNVSASHIRALLAGFEETSDIVASDLEGQAMPPAVFGARHFAALCDLNGEHGARELLRNARTVSAAGSVLSDIDTYADMYWR